MNFNDDTDVKIDLPGIFLLLGDSRAYGLDSCNRHLRIGDITVPRHIASVLNFKQFFRYDRRVVADETSGEIVSTGETAVAQRIHGIGQFPSALKVYPIFPSTERFTPILTVGAMLILTNISMPNTLLFCKVSSSAISVLSLNETNVTILFSCC